MSKFDQTLKILKDQNQPLESIEENNDISQEKLDRQNELLEKLHIKTDRLRPITVKSIVTQQSDQQDKIVDAINEGFKSNVKEIVVKENKKLSSVVTTQQSDEPQEEVLINAGVKAIDVAGKTVSAVKKTNKSIDDLADKFDNDANKFSKSCRWSKGCGRRCRHCKSREFF